MIVAGIARLWKRFSIDYSLKQTEQQSYLIYNGNPGKHEWAQVVPTINMVVTVAYFDII
jgi:hypothetical protein